MNQALAWKNGQMLPFADLSLHVSDLGVVAGAAITEMARTFGHKPFRLAKHIQRLLKSCDELGFSVRYSAAELCSVAGEVVEANSKLIDPDRDLGIVVFVTAGSNTTYLGTADLPHPTVAIHTFSLPFELWQPASQHGLSLVVPQRQQISASSLPVHRKVRNRLHWWLADHEAAAQKPGSRALLLDENGFVTETSNGCFYAVIDGEIVTPVDNVLDSMSRRIVEDAAISLGMKFTRRNIRTDKFSLMTAAFVSSTPFGVIPVRSINELEFETSYTLVLELAEYWKSLTAVNPLQQIREASR